MPSNHLLKYVQRQWNVQLSFRNTSQIKEWKLLRYLIVGITWVPWYPHRKIPPMQTNAMFAYHQCKQQNYTGKILEPVKVKKNFFYPQCLVSVLGIYFCNRIGAMATDNLAEELFPSLAMPDNIWRLTNVFMIYSLAIFVLPEYIRVFLRQAFPEDSS